MAPVTKTGIWAGAVVSAGTKIAAQRRMMVSRIDPVLVVLACVHMVDRKRLGAVAALMVYLKNLKAIDTNPMQEIQGWVDAGQMLVNEQPSSSGLVATFSEVVKSLTNKEGVARVASIVVEMMLHSAPRGDVQAALLSALEDTIRHESGHKHKHTNDGIEAPHVVNLEHYLPPVTVFYPSSYNPKAFLHKTIKSIATWHDPRNVLYWNTGIKELISNAHATASHDTTHPETISLPISVYASEVLTPVVYCVWTVDPVPYPVSRWSVLCKFEAMESCYKNTKPAKDVHLTEAAVKEMAAVLNPYDQPDFQDIYTEMKGSFGVLSLVHSSHGLSVYRFTLSKPLPSGLDVLYLVRYRNESSVDESDFEPLATSVVWLPPVWQAFNPGPFRVGQMPPSGIIEYLFSRSATTYLSGKEWRSYPFSEKYAIFDDVVRQCTSSANPRAKNEALYNQALAAIENLPQAKQVIKGLCWRARSEPIMEWLNLSKEDVKKKTKEFITSDELAITWTPHGSLSDMGDAWLIDLTAPFLSVQQEDCLTFVNGKILRLSWVSLQEKVNDTVPELLNMKLAMSKRIISRRDNIETAALQFLDSGVYNVDISEVTAVVADPSSLLIINGSKVDETDTTSTLLQNIFRELVDTTTATPLNIHQALSIQFLHWRGTTYLAMLSGAKCVLACVATEEMCTVQRLTSKANHQPYLVLNNCIRAVKNGNQEARLVIETGDASGTYHAGPSICSFSTKDGKWGAWAKDTENIGAGWAICVPEHVFVRADDTNMQVNGWMVDQTRPFAYYLDKALAQLPQEVVFANRSITGTKLTDTYTTSTVVLWGAYSSCSDHVENEKQTVLSITGNVRDITPWNWTSRQKHYLYLPNSTFQVVSVSNEAKHHDISLREIGVGESLEIFIRTIMPTLTYKKAPDYIRQLFTVMQEIEKQRFERALNAAVAPHKEMLGRDEQIDASDGVTITREIMRLVNNEEACCIMLQHALLEAARSGAYCAVGRLIVLGVDPDCVDSEKNTSLHLAAGNSCEKTIRELLNVGADPKLLTLAGETVLHVALKVMKRFSDPAILLQLCGPTTINASDSHGTTPLQHAVINEAEDTLLQLIKLGADPNLQCVSASKRKGVKPKTHTVLHVASSLGFVGVTKTLLQNGANPDIVDSSGQVSLHLAIESTEFVSSIGLETITKLITHESVQKRDKQQVTPLHIAASLGQLEVIKLILHSPAAQGLDLTDRMDMVGHTPLQAAALMFEVDIVLYLMPLTKSKLKKSDFQRNKVAQAGKMLHRAVYNDEIEKVGLLLSCGVSTDVETKEGSLLHKLCMRSAFSSEAGVKVIETLCKNSGGDKRDINGKTALHAAAEAGLIPAVKVLLQQTVDPNISDKEGMTVIHHMCLQGAMDVLYVLVWYDRLVRKLPADLNVVDKLGRTPLYIAAEMGYVEIVRFLLEENVRVSAVSNEGHTAEEIAAINQHIDIVHLIIGNTGKVNLPTSHARVAVFKVIYKGDCRELKRLLDTYRVDFLMVSDKGTNMLHEMARLAAFNTDDGCAVMKEIMGRENMAMRANDPVMGAGVTALHIASFAGHMQMAETLLEGGCNPDAYNDDGMLPIQLAASRLRIDIVMLLLKYSSYKVSIRDFPISSLHRAAETGNVNAVNMLLDYGLSPVEADCFEGTPSGKLCSYNGNIVGAVPLHYAVLKNEFCSGAGLKALRRLITERTVLAGTVNQRSTALHLASVTWHDTCHVVEMLLENGSDPNVKDAKGYVPLELAVANGAMKIIPLLDKVTEHKMDLGEYLLWAKCDVLVHSSVSDVRSRCDDWLATHSTMFADLVNWTPAKARFLGCTGSALVVRHDFVKLEFHEEDGTTNHECFPRSAVTRLMYTPLD